MIAASRQLKFKLVGALRLRRKRSDQPRTKNQEPRTKNQEPRTKNQEPRTKNQEPRTKNQELPPPAASSTFPDKSLVVVA
jgi:hypothetical protein